MLVITAGSLMHMLIAVGLLFTVYAVRGELVERPGAEVAVQDNGPADEAGLQLGRHRAQHRRGDRRRLRDELGAARPDARAGRRRPDRRRARWRAVDDRGGARARTPTRPARRSASAYLGVGSRTASALGRDVDSATPRPPASSTSFPSAWESTKGVVKVLNPVNIWDQLTGETDGPGDAADDCRRRDAGQRDDRGDRVGLVGVLLLLAALNVFVGVFNMFPLLPLDGGHAAIATYERIRESQRSPLLRRRLQADAVRDGRDRGASAAVHVRSLPRHHPAAAMITGTVSERRKTRQIHVGSVAVGGGAPDHRCSR